MAQRDYGYAQPLGVPGGIFDLGGKQIVSRTLDDGVKIKPGMGLVVGAKPGETAAAQTEASTAEKFEGIVVHGSKNMEHTMEGSASAFGYDTVGVMQKGRIWALVASTATTTYGTKAALILSGNNAGKFTSSADASETKKMILSAEFTGKADIDSGIAVIEL